MQRFFLLTTLLGVAGCIDLTDRPLAFTDTDAGFDAGAALFVCERCDAPGATCRDSSTLLTSYLRACSDTCQFGQLATVCSSGCDAGQCIGEPCAGLTCTTPPGATCVSSSTLRTSSPAGTCSNGTCQYTTIDFSCAVGCVNGACTGEPCAGKSCTVPPHSQCEGSTLRVFAVTGACEAETGLCTSTSTEVACANGCSNGACIDDACAGVVCNQVPAASCVDEKNRQVFSDSSCSGGVCTYASTIEACAGAKICRSGACIDVTAASCTDETTNQDESDVDCGGLICAKCGNARICRGPNDCLSGACASGRCTEPSATCRNNQKDGLETDVDCGGSCSACPTGKVCEQHADCLSSTCIFGICRDPTCSDGVRNQDESDIDCGGTHCTTKCTNTKYCGMPTDCATGCCEVGRCEAKNACGGCGAPPLEVCNGRDDNCNGQVDDAVVDHGSLCPNQAGACAGSIGRCVGTRGYVCDETAYRIGNANYSTSELATCDGIDNDCDGTTDRMTTVERVSIRPQYGFDFLSVTPSGRVLISGSDVDAGTSIIWAQMPDGGYSIGHKFATNVCETAGEGDVFAGITCRATDIEWGTLDGGVQNFKLPSRWSLDAGASKGGFIRVINGLPYALWGKTGSNEGVSSMEKVIYMWDGGGFEGTLVDLNPYNGANSVAGSFAASPGAGIVALYRDERSSSNDVRCRWASFDNTTSAWSSYPASDSTFCSPFSWLATGANGAVGFIGSWFGNGPNNIVSNNVTSAPTVTPYTMPNWLSSESLVTVSNPTGAPHVVWRTGGSKGDAGISVMSLSPTSVSEPVALPLTIPGDHAYVRAAKYKGQLVILVIDGDQLQLVRHLTCP